MTRRAAANRPAAAPVQVYSGRDYVGTVEPTDDGFVARDTRGRVLGKLPNRRDAVRAVVQAAHEAI